MLVPWGRVFIRGAGLKPLLLCKQMTVSGGQFFLVRALATTATKKVASSKSKTAVARSKAPAKKQKPSTTRTKQGATRKVAAKSATTRAGVKKATKKVAAKKTAAKKTAAKKVAAKKGTVKTKTRTTTRKPVSEEEKGRVKMRAKVKSLLEQALKPPPISSASPWVAFLTEKLKGSHTNASTYLKEGMAKLKEEYTSLTPGQVEVRSLKQLRDA